MYAFVPTNMEEVAEKMKWNLEHSITATEESVIQEAVLANAQDMLDGDLEGAYWKARWGTDDKKLNILDVLGNEIDCISPLHETFVEDFRDNAQALIRYLSEKVQEIVNKH